MWRGEHRARLELCVGACERLQQLLRAGGLRGEALGGVERGEPFGEERHVVDFPKEALDLAGRLAGAVEGGGSGRSSGRAVGGQWRQWEGGGTMMGGKAVGEAMCRRLGAARWHGPRASPMRTPQAKPQATAACARRLGSPS